jgi:hypothetical protein
MTCQETALALRGRVVLSPEFNPIEKMWSKIKASLRSAQARTQPALIEAIARALESVTAQDARNWFAHCGYSFI